MSKVLKTGFTLIEVVVAIGIFILMMLAIHRVFVVFYMNQKQSIQTIERTNKARYVINVMSNELRQMNRGQGGGFRLVTAEKNKIVFYSDLDNDKETEKIEYYVQNNILYKSVLSAGSFPYYSGTSTVTVVFDGVMNGVDGVFSYYNQDYTGTETALAFPVDNIKVKLVGINLLLDDVNSSLTPVLNFSTKVQLRNF